MRIKYKNKEKVGKAQNINITEMNKDRIMKKLLIGIMLLTSASIFASNYMVLNVTSIHDTGIKNLIGLNGRAIGTIDCSDLPHNGAVIDIRQYTDMTNGSVSITLKKDEGKKVYLAESYYFQDEQSCSEAIRLIEERATLETPISLVLDSFMQNKVFISQKH